MEPSVGLDESEERAMYDRAAATWAQLIWEMPCVEQLDLYRSLLAELRVHHSQAI